jgi:cbb3-type cytochrome oxidase subunit 3
MVNELLIGGMASAVGIVFLFLVFITGMFYQNSRDGIIDLNDYKNTRLQLVATEAVDEELEASADQQDDG